MFKGSILFFVCALYCTSLLCASPAFAHAVYIFAWVDGESICTESYFSKNSKVRGGVVNGVGSKGNILFTGSTDEGGKVCFPLPEQAQDIEFAVSAGEGHRGTFTLREEDVAPFLPPGEKAIDTTAAIDKHEAAPVIEPLEQTGTYENLAADNVSEQVLREIVREELKKQLAPIQQQVGAITYDRSPGWKDIFGGLGWIAAVASLAYTVMNAKRKA
jgi:hypothetical protein